MSEKKHASSYLENLTFDENLKKMPVAGYLGNIRLVILVLLTVIGLGLFSFFTLPRELNPSIDITIVTVNTVLPGASPEDMESLVTVPIEDEIEGIDDIEKITSSSREGISSIVVEFVSGVNSDKAKDDVQAAVDSVSDLPEDAQTPVVNKLDFEDTPVWIFSLSAGDDIPGLNRFAENIRDRIEEEPVIDRVELAGLEEREIQIVARPEIVRERNLTPFVLSNAISSALSSYPAGTVTSDDLSFALTIDPAIESVEDIRNTRIMLQGEMFTVGQIATVTERASPGQPRAFQASLEDEVSQIVTVAVYKSQGEKIDVVAELAQEIVEEETEEFPHITATTIQDLSDEIDEQFVSLGRSFGSTIFLVFLIMFLFLGIREAFLSSLSIPLAVLIGFFVMFVTDITLNFISLFSLILALGLLVDNAIVIVSAVNQYYRSGKFSSYETGLLVFKDYFIALLSTNITTVWAFFPLILATGIIGEFIEPIPIIVSATIIASAFVGFFLALPISLVVLAPSIPKRVKIMFSTIIVILLIVMVASSLPPEIYSLIKKPFEIPFEPQSLYLRTLIGYINNIIAIVTSLINYLLPLAILAALVAAVLYTFSKTMGKASRAVGRSIKRNAGLSRAQEFTTRSIDSGFISLKGVSKGYKKRMYAILDKGRNQWKVITLVVIFSVISYLLPVLGLVQNIFFPAGDQEIVYVSIELPPGSNIQQSEAEALRVIEHLRDTPELEFVSAEIGRVPENSESPPSDNLILFTLNLTKTEERELTSLDISKQLREEFAGYQKGKISVVELSDGPPAGADINIRYFGDDLSLLNDFANETMDYLSGQQNVTNIDKSIKSGTGKLSFVPDNKKLSDYGLTESDVGIWLRSYASGFTLDELEIGDTDYDIVFRMYPDKGNPGDINSITIPTSDGFIPLNALGETVLKTNPTVISREDGKRVIAVTASVTEGGNISQIGQKLERWADAELGLPPGYSWQTGGVNEENQESLQSIFLAMILSGILILITLVVQLGSFRKAIIVMLVIPLAVSGVLILFGLFGIPLSFPAMIGLLALFGIVVNNSILVVEKINQNLNAGFDLRESIADASSTRLEPIMLTSMTTIIGLVPITMTDPTWRGLGGAIICGLVFSGAIMLFFIPTVYWMWFPDIREREAREKEKQK